MNVPRNISLTLEYDGSDYHGWQCQPNGVTVQEIVQRCIEKILNHPVKLYAAGRTDTGVHAFGQVVNFLTEKSIELDVLIKGLNSLLPDDIRVKKARDVPASFHARYSVKSKSYIYIIANTRFHSPFNMKYSWNVPYPLDHRRMDEAIRQLIGVHDFSSFKKKSEMYRKHDREIVNARVLRRGKFVYVFIEATGFLRYMVRNIVGTLVQIGGGKMAHTNMLSILEARDRAAAGTTAPPHGLFLRRIRY